MRKRCCVCNHLTNKWQSYNGSFFHCFDGCKSTTGYDHRKQVTEDGKMAYRATPVEKKNDS